MAETVIEPGNFELKGLKLSAEIDLDPAGRPSGSGKNMVVASTGGFVQVGEYKISINIIKKRR